MNLNLAYIESLAKIGLATFAGAFFGALTLTAMPSTLDGWKAILAPALGAAIAAEVVFLRAQLGAYLATVTPTSNASPANAVLAAQPAAILATSSKHPPPINPDSEKTQP
jgi:hypothetical protein